MNHGLGLRGINRGDGRGGAVITRHRAANFQFIGRERLRRRRWTDCLISVGAAQVDRDGSACPKIFRLPIGGDLPSSLVQADHHTAILVCLQAGIPHQGQFRPVHIEGPAYAIRHGDQDAIHGHLVAHNLSQLARKIERIQPG